MVSNTHMQKGRALRIAVGLIMLVLLLVNAGAGTFVDLQVREAAESNTSNTDSISSGINSMHYTVGLGVSNQGVIDIKNLTVNMTVDNIVAVDNEEYAQWNNSFVQWILPQNIILNPHMVRFVSLETDIYNLRYMPMEIHRSVNKSIFNSDGYQSVVLTFSFENTTSLKEGWNWVTIGTTNNNTLILNDTFSTDAPINTINEISEQTIRFTLNPNLVETNRSYNISLIYKIKLTENISSIKFKPYFAIGLGKINSSYQDIYPSQIAIMPNDMLPEHVHHISVSTNISPAWSYRIDSLRYMELHTVFKKTLTSTPTPTPTPTVTPTSTPSPTPIVGTKGDVSGDGQVSVVDALFIAQYTVGTRTLISTQLAAADVNNDDQVTIVDALFIAQYTVGLRQL